MKSSAPVLFISHGAPTFALEPGALGARLQALGTQLDGIQAVLILSPHWQSREVRVMTTTQPETIHDFGGFPAALYRLRYPVAGQPALAQEAARVLAEAGFPVALEERRGLDHGAWVPMMHLRPAGDLPVFQVSLPISLDTRGAVALGRALAPLREQGVLLLASGAMTHNLYEFRQGGGPEPYAVAFANWVRAAVARGDIEAVIDYRRQAPHAERTHPSEEHFLPLLAALGAIRSDEAMQMLDDTMTYGVISMESYAWGAPQLLAA